MSGILFSIYNTLLLLLLPFIACGIVLKWRKRIVAKGFFRWRERWGRFSDDQKQKLCQGRWWWVHAVSVGEVKAIESFLRQAPEQSGAKIILTLVTPEALVWAEQQKLAEIITAAPFDLPWVVRKVAKRVRPEWFISVESEFWPNLLRQARKSGAKVALINGRLSQRSFQSYLKIRALMGVLWHCFDVLAVRQDEDADRFGKLGVPSEKIKVTGNLKYDVMLPSFDSVKDLQSPLIVLGSTREAEESILLPILKNLRQQWPGLRVIWAPRHVERAEEIQHLLTQAGWFATFKSRRDPSSSANDLDLIWDTMGNLIEAYAQADIVLIGGSFVPKGGQNPLEPAAYERPVLFGPSMENFRGIADELVMAGGAQQVSLSGLEQTLRRLLSNPAEGAVIGKKGYAFLKSRQGATQRTISLLLSWGAKL